MDERGVETLPYPKEKRRSWKPAIQSMILNPALRAYVRQHAEDRPGIYRMLGPEKEVLYVGKSVRVKSRPPESFP